MHSAYAFWSAASLAGADEPPGLVDEPPVLADVSPGPVDELPGPPAGELAGSTGGELPPHAAVSRAMLIAAARIAAWWRGAGRRSRPVLGVIVLAQPSRFMVLS
jgi:hypothetical protein